MTMLDGKRRSATDADDDENANMKKSQLENTHVLKTATTIATPESHAAPAKAAVSSTEAGTASNLTSNNYTIICVNASKLSGPGVASIRESVNK